MKRGQGPLSTAFLAELSQDAVNVLGEVTNLEAQLKAIVTTACKYWPTLKISPTRFIAYVGARTVRPTPETLVSRSLAVSDLYLALAYQEGHAAAVREMEQRISANAKRAARRLCLSFDEAADARQQMLEAVLVGDGNVPGIANYTGQGPLDAWLGATAFRIGIRVRTRARRERACAVEESTNAWAQTDLELAFIKRRYRESFNIAFRAALESLSSREKSVLKLHLHGGLNIERIGICYKVHRATVARWIAAARRKLLAETREALAQDLALPQSEIDSLVGVLNSQIDVSLAKFLVNSTK